MKRPIMMFCAVVLIALTAAGCEDEVEDLATDSSAVDRVRVGDLTFTLQILNMQDEPQAVFEEGENFQFQFLIDNRDDSAYVFPIIWGFPATNKEFFALYRRTQESGGKARLGKSFEIGPNFRDAAPVTVPARGQSIYTIPWLTSKDSLYTMPTYTEQGEPIDPSILARRYLAATQPPPLLSTGEYFTGFTIQYSETDSVRLEVSFTVE